MAIIDIAAKVLRKGYVCDSCLGRQFAQLLSGYTNEQRGRAIRQTLAEAIDAGEKLDVDLSNFHSFKFRQQKIKTPKPSKCWVCSGLFEKIDELASRAAKEAAKVEFNRFHVGVVLSKDLSQQEEKLWEAAGIEWTESIKSELSREIGKRLAAILKKEVDLEKPEVVVLINLAKDRVELDVNPLFVYGRYKKFAEMPQTRWPCRECRGRGCERCDFTGKMYATSVEERIGKTFLAASGGDDTRFHGAGREDIDVRCLDWREFVIELTKPKRRALDLRAIEKKINRANEGEISVSGLRFADRDEVRQVKERRVDKVYRVVFEVPKDARITPADLKKLGSLKGTIKQKTPTRVLHRRADIVRKRKVKDISAKKVGRRVTIEVRAESGLYIKELVSGDSGRTSPSVAEILKTEPRILDVSIVKIYSKS